MEIQQPQTAAGWRMRVTYKNATILVCVLNIATAALLLQSFLSAASRRHARHAVVDPVQLRYIIESEEMRRAMEPLELIKRVREIEQEAYVEPEIETQKAPKQTAAADLSKRLKDLRAINDANSQKALEEWRKRKMERARQREIEKNGTVATQA